MKAGFPAAGAGEMKKGEWKNPARSAAAVAANSAFRIFLTNRLPELLMEYDLLPPAGHRDLAHLRKRRMAVISSQ